MIVGDNLGHRAIVAGASMSVSPGEFVVLLGPNGAGKTTLLRLMLGLLRADSGRATIGGEDVARLAPAERARRVAYLPQARPLAWPAGVRDIVALGRFAHGAAPGRLRDTDAAAVERALAAATLGPLAARAADTLSGGELARVHVARALAAEAPLIVADEPVASLDPRHQHQLLALLRAHVTSGGGVLAVLHDLDLAARYADRLVWMADGRIVADGSVVETMTAARIASIYGIAARVEQRDGAIAVTIDGAL